MARLAYFKGKPTEVEKLRPVQPDEIIVKGLSLPSYTVLGKGSRSTSKTWAGFNGISDIIWVDAQQTILARSADGEPLSVITVKSWLIQISVDWFRNKS